MAWKRGCHLPVTRPTAPTHHGLQHMVTWLTAYGHMAYSMWLHDFYSPLLPPHQHGSQHMVTGITAPAHMAYSTGLTA